MHSGLRLAHQGFPGFDERAVGQTCRQRFAAPTTCRQHREPDAGVALISDALMVHIYKCALSYVESAAKHAATEHGSRLKVAKGRKRRQ